jgi:hypothetical protein
LSRGGRVPPPADTNTPAPSPLIHNTQYAVMDYGACAYVCLSHIIIVVRAVKKERTAKAGGATRNTAECVFYSEGVETTDPRAGRRR